MLLSEALNEMLRRKQWTKVRLAKEAGHDNVTPITTPISRENILLSSLLRLANAAGYDVMLVNRDVAKGERPITLEVPPEKMRGQKKT